MFSAHSVCYNIIIALMLWGIWWMYYPRDPVISRVSILPHRCKPLSRLRLIFIIQTLAFALFWCHIINWRSISRRSHNLDPFPLAMLNTSLYYQPKLYMQLPNNLLGFMYTRSIFIKPIPVDRRNWFYRDSRGF